MQSTKKHILQSGYLLIGAMKHAGLLPLQRCSEMTRQAGSPGRLHGNLMLRVRLREAMQKRRNDRFHYTHKHTLKSTAVTVLKSKSHFLIIKVT